MEASLGTTVAPVTIALCTALQFALRSRQQRHDAAELASTVLATAYELASVTPGGKPLDLVTPAPVAADAGNESVPSPVAVDMERPPAS